MTDENIYQDFINERRIIVRFLSMEINDRQDEIDRIQEEINLLRDLADNELKTIKQAEIDGKIDTTK